MRIRFELPSPLESAVSSLPKIPQFLALDPVSTVVMQTERMFDVKARMVLVLAQAPNISSNTSRFAWCWSYPVSIEAQALPKISILVIISDVSVL